MTTTCQRHKKCRAIPGGFKKLSSDLTRVLHVLEKKFFLNFALNVFFMKELKGAILFQNHRRSQGVGPVGLGPLNCNATNDKNLTTKKLRFFIFSFF